MYEHCVVPLAAMHDFAALLGYGACAVNPYLAHASIARLIQDGLLEKDYYAAVNDYDKATGDLKHQIELGAYKDRNKAATALKQVLQKRRIHKDYVDINSELNNYFRDPEFIKVYRKLEQILGTVRKQEKYVEGQRVYKPRYSSALLTIKTKEEE